MSVEDRDDSERRPRTSRRREVRKPSARSVLLTLLGEFVLPSGRPVWTSTIVEALGLLGVEEQATRQALHRAAGEGWIAPARAGRRVRWQLTAAGRELLESGAARIYSFGRPSRRWAGEWLAIVVSVPESHRALRHRLRTRLTWAGFGSPAPGLWVSPDVAREADAHALVEELGLAGSAFSLRGSFGSIGSAGALVAAAWDLDDLAARYEVFAAEFRALVPRTGPAVLGAQVRLVDAWRRFPFVDPQLPDALLPRGWVGHDAARLFRRKHAAWHEPAQRYWARLLDEHDR